MFISYDDNDYTTGTSITTTPRAPPYLVVRLGNVEYFLFNDISTFIELLMPKPSMLKNSMHLATRVRYDARLIFFLLLDYLPTQE